MVTASRSGSTDTFVKRHPAVGYLILAILGFVVMEGLLYFVLQMRLKSTEVIENPLITAGSHEMYLADHIPDPVAFREEGERLYGPALIYHPYRWYAMPPDFAGSFHQTDHHGFRNGILDNTATSVAFFGGSNPN